jgi:hypothetical protein
MGLCPCIITQYPANLAPCYHSPTPCTALPHPSQPSHHPTLSPLPLTSRSTPSQHPHTPHNSTAAHQRPVPQADICTCLTAMMSVLNHPAHSSALRWSQHQHTCPHPPHACAGVAVRDNHLSEGDAWVLAAVVALNGASSPKIGRTNKSAPPLSPCGVMWPAALPAHRRRSSHACDDA